MKYNIIKTENYLLIVSDDEIKEGDKCIAIGKTYNNTIVVYRKSPCPPPFVSNLNILNKIIAHLPLNNADYLIGVDLLPPLEDEARIWARNQFSCNPDDYEECYYIGLEKGYNTAKEKYKYTENDLIKAADLYYEFKGKKSIEDFIEELKQPKLPIAFECEIEVCVFGNHTEYDSKLEDYVKPKTINNSEGKTEWVGKYIF